MMYSGDISSMHGVMWVQAESDRRHHERPPHRKPRKPRVRIRVTPGHTGYSDRRRPSEADDQPHIDITI